ncbi:uncharacterized protein EKO05_0003200 [Ascochyta rabiei]|uniref:uncharacterized protein n=1 Tax=Didymella rabiei TaxID=5454 RepID=UPI001902331F|nr:uncharacterized protein EKO05_0003200 [Ascochyta rabiei]UPX12659.1 hypothetical protein EKO05_0003200 [Ascochyta rabiei]
MQYSLFNTNSSSFNGPIPSLPPNLYLVTLTTTFKAADPYYISTLKPDITVSLAHTAFTLRHQQQLIDYQAAGFILSDLHAADIGVCFLFLVVEAKGLSVNGSLVSAQNQSAICSASMLQILKDLNSQTPALDPGPLSSTTPALCFSVVTEGPVYKLWVHFHHNSTVYMVLLWLWRTTHTRSANKLVLFLVRIMDWGRSAFRDSVVQKLDNIPEQVRSRF